MIKSLYDPFKKWTETGSIYILSDLHLDDEDCRLMDPTWITPEEQIKIINSMVQKGDTFICLGDVGKADYIEKIKADRKILILGNHDRRSQYEKVFDEIYSGPLFISDRILLSHEPIPGLPWCLNIHGHDHNEKVIFPEDCQHINMACNIASFTPINLAKEIKAGTLRKVKNIHRMTIDGAVERKNGRNL